MHRSDLSHAVRQRLERLPPPHAAHYGVVPPPPPEEGIALGSAGAAVARAEQAMGEAAALAGTLKDPFLVSRVLRRKEAVSSSAIEGTNSTLDELLAAEEEGATAETTPDTQQARDYAVALESLLPRAGREGAAVFSRDLIEQLHAGVMGSAPDNHDAGHIRDRVVWIGGTGHISSSTYNPPPPARLADCLATHVAYLRGEGMHAITQGLVTRMGIAHAHFEAIHPFRDGNGRVGRLLLPLMMVSEGRIPLYLSPYIEANRQHYYSALKAAQQREEWSAIIGFMADAITETVLEVRRTSTALQTLRDEWQARTRTRKGSAAARAIELLHEYPVITIGRLATLLDVSFQAASTAAAQLAQIGVLVEKTGHRRNRVFVAEEAIRILNRRFGD